MVCVVMMELSPLDGLGVRLAQREAGVRAGEGAEDG